MNQAPPPPPGQSSGGIDAGTWVMLCHLSGLSGYIVPFGNIIGPLVIWLTKKDDLPAIDDQGKEALNFQISFTIYTLVSALLCMAFIGIPLLIGVVIAQLVLTILAAIKGHAGEMYRYPMSIKFVK